MKQGRRQAAQRHNRERRGQRRQIDLTKVDRANARASDRWRRNAQEQATNDGRHSVRKHATPVLLPSSSAISHR